MTECSDDPQFTLPKKKHDLGKHANALWASLNDFTQPTTLSPQNTSPPEILRTKFV